jgi:hypothetical protein
MQGMDDGHHEMIRRIRRTSHDPLCWNLKPGPEGHLKRGWPLMAGAGTPENQIEKNQNSYRDRTNEIPGFIHIDPGKRHSLIPNC